jgi:hypothetical protein
MRGLSRLALQLQSSCREIPRSGRSRASAASPPGTSLRSSPGRRDRRPDPAEQRRAVHARRQRPRCPRRTAVRGRQRRGLPCRGPETLAVAEEPSEIPGGFLATYQDPGRGHHLRHGPVDGPAPQGRNSCHRTPVEHVRTCPPEWLARGGRLRGAQAVLQAVEGLVHQRPEGPSWRS